jgi:hypothetical protein
MDSELLDLLRTSVRHVLMSADTTPIGERLIELGWRDVVADAPAAALKMLFEVRGDTLSPAGVLDVVLTDRLAELSSCEGASGRALLLAPTLRDVCPSGRLTDGRVDIDGVALSPVEPGAPVVVSMGAPDGAVRLGLVNVPHGARVCRINGMDPSLGLTAVTALVPARDVEWIDGRVAQLFDEIVALGRCALSAELLGLARHMVASAVQYACDRRQYGRPIGSFQAVQHRLADAHAAIVGADAVLTEVFAERSSFGATVAKALAGRAFEEASRQSQQVYGAIGFTWEHEFHRYLRRGYVLDTLFGDWRTLQVEIGTEVLETQRVPRVGSL